MKFQQIQIAGWRQFLDVEINFHPRMTVITGANGAGKSTLLRILSQHFGVPFQPLATPKADKSGIVSYILGIFGSRHNKAEAISRVGEIIYSNNHRSYLAVNQSNAVQYNISIENQAHLWGLFINSHRPVSNYQQVGSIPTNAITTEVAYQQYNQELMMRLSNSNTGLSPTYRIKEAIISMATFGLGNANVAGNESLAKSYQDFKVILSKILPESIGFIDIQVRIPDVVIVTSTGEFIFDAASGGLMSLIDLSWQIFLYSQGKDDFVVVMDEPENHLHPSMQRTVLPSLVDAFPAAQFIVATHSPFVVSSVKDSAVYALRYRDMDGAGEEYLLPGERRVISELLSFSQKGGAASEILKSVLGVPVTMPVWAERSLDEIASAFSVSDLNAEGIADLRRRLDNAGLGDFYGETLGKITAQ